MQQGHLLEQIIANFNSHFFMNDFVFLNPKYFSYGNEKGLCDLLLILNDECIVISVKGTDGRYKSDSKLQNWLVKKTWEGSKQAKGGVNWLKKVSFTGRNLWNEDRKFARIDSQRVGALMGARRLSTSAPRLWPPRK